MADADAEGRPGSVKWADDDDHPTDPGNTCDTDPFAVEEAPPKGCWYYFTHFLCGMWATKQINRSRQEDGREIFVRTTIRELIVYSIFLVVLCILTFGMTSATMFYYTKVMKGLFNGADGVAKTEDLWTYMEGPLLNGLYWEYLYNTGNDKNFICPGGEEHVGPCPVAPADRNILYENRLLGLPRIREIRVKNDSCSIHPDFQNAIKTCYEAYSSSIEDKLPFGSGYRKRTGADAWRYRSESELGTSAYSGTLGTYTGGGAYQDLATMKNESLAIIQELKEGLWIDRGTRFLTIDFTVYNANINLFCIIKLTFEFPATGGIISKAWYNTVKLLRYVTAYDYFIFATEMIFLAFIIYYIVEETLEIMKYKCSYFTTIWNNLDVVVLLLSISTMFLNYYTQFIVEARLTELLSKPDQYANFNDLADWSKMSNNFVAINVFCAWVKMFKYISFNKTMTQLSSTLSRCAKDVAGFAVMFFIVFFAFAQLGHLLFGTQVKDFSSFADAIFTLLRTILGDFDFHAIERANRFLGPVFFVSYVFFVFFVLLNMFLAIINDTYSVVKEELATQKNDFEISDYLMRGYNNVMGSMNNRDRDLDLENALKMSRDEEGVVNYNELRQNLKKLDFADMEIEMFFSRYDIDDNNVLDDEDICMMEENARPVSGRQARSARSARIRPQSAMSGIVNTEFEVLDRRVIRMESSIGSIVNKIDAVLVRLETMEGSKARRRAAMNKMLNSITENDDVDEATKRKQMEALVLKELEERNGGGGMDSRPGTGKF